MTKCYSCEKDIGIFKSRGKSKDIIRAGYEPPEGMLEHHVLCQDCLDNIRQTQTQGEKLNERVNMAGQIILCFFFPLLSFWRINKTRKFLKYYFIIIAVVLVGVLVPVYAFPDNSDVSTVGFTVFALFYFGWWIVPMIWVYSWTKEYNKNSI